MEILAGLHVAFCLVIFPGTVPAGMTPPMSYVQTGHSMEQHTYDFGFPVSSYALLQCRMVTNMYS